MQFIKDVLGVLFWAVVLMINPVPEAEEPALLHMEQARAALSLDGIMLYDFNAMWMGDAFTAFTMPQYRSRGDTEDLRMLALAELSARPGWHVEAVDAAQVTSLLRVYCPELMLFPAADTVYEAWFFQQGREYPQNLPSSMPKGTWTLGFFDADDGVWLHLDSESVLASSEGIHTEGYIMGDVLTLKQNGPISLTCIRWPEVVDAAFAEMDAAWNHTAITGAELARLMDATQEEVWPRLYPEADIVFDCWVWEDRSDGKAYEWNTRAFPSALREAGITDTRDWLLTLVDRETGMIVTYQYSE